MEGSFCYEPSSLVRKKPTILDSKSKHLFDGTIELQSTPIPTSGAAVLRQMYGINNSYSKVSKFSKK